MNNGGVLYYTDNRLDPKIFAVCKSQLRKAFAGEIVCSSLKPVPEFRRTVVLDDAEPGYVTMVRQIIRGLEELKSEYVFFCEHDVLYHPSHFDFVPEKEDTFYYNENVWRWDYPNDRFLRWDNMLTLSQLCVNRKLALTHYRMRLAKIYELGYDKLKSKEPDWARKWGYEPGGKKTRNGGFSQEASGTWKAALPNIDIRHGKNYSPPKVTLESFKHPPVGWKETTQDKIFGWNFNELFL